MFAIGRNAIHHVFTFAFVMLCRLAPLITNAANITTTSQSEWSLFTADPSTLQTGDVITLSTQVGSNTLVIPAGITAFTIDGGGYALMAPIRASSDLALTLKKITVNGGGARTINTTASLTLATEETVTITSGSDVAVISVNGDFTITGGSPAITGTGISGSALTLSKTGGDISLASTTGAISLGSTNINISGAAVTVSGINNAISSSTGITSVSLIATGHLNGSLTVSGTLAITGDNGLSLTASLSFTVNAPAYGITGGSSTGGSGSANRTSAAAGETVMLTVYPASGYGLSAISVFKTGDATVSVSLNGFNGFNGLNGSFTIRTYNMDGTITATPYTIPAGNESAEASTSVHFRSHTLYICSPAAETVEVYSFSVQPFSLKLSRCITRWLDCFATPPMTA